MASIYSISEQVHELLKSNPSAASSVTKGQIEESIRQALSSVLKTQYFDTTMAGGEVIPEGVVIACYDNQTVSSYKDVAKCTLPAIPISLPKGIGVWHVSKTSDLHNPFIPIPRGQTAMIGDEPLISDLLGQVGYEVRVDTNSDPALIFNVDITDATEMDPAVTSVYMELLVYDVSKYSDYDLLPIPPDMESMVIERVFKLLSTTPAAEEIVDPTTDTK